MRLYLDLTPNDTTMPFCYAPVLTGALHKWLGSTNQFHDDISLYSLSWLNNGQIKKDGFDFKKGSSMFIAAHEGAFLHEIYKGIKKDPTICNGMRVKSIQIVKDPPFYSRRRFVVNSPVLIKRFSEGFNRYYSYKDKEASSLLNETIHRKLKKAGLEYDINIRFDTQHPTAKFKRVNYKNIINYASSCPIIAEGHPEAIKFLWNVGVGNSTGCGFGAIN